MNTTEPTFPNRHRLTIGCDNIELSILHLNVFPMLQPHCVSDLCQAQPKVTVQKSIRKVIAISKVK